MDREKMSLQQQYVADVLGISGGLLKKGMKVMLKPELNFSLPDNPGQDLDGVMKSLAGSIVTVLDMSESSIWFRIIEDSSRFAWDSRWIDYIVPDEDVFEPAPDADFELLFL